MGATLRQSLGASHVLSFSFWGKFCSLEADEVYFLQSILERFVLVIVGNYGRKKRD